MDLFIYYRVPVSDAQALLQRVQTMQSRLLAEWQVQASLKRRADEAAGGHQTWMEIYLQVPDGFLPALDAAVHQAGLMDLIDGARHVETFVDVVTCA